MTDLRSGALLGALVLLAVATPDAQARPTQAKVPPGPSAADTNQPGAQRVRALGDTSLAPRTQEAPSATWACTVATVATQRPCLLEGALPDDEPLARRDAEALSIRDALCALAAPASDRALCALVVDTASASCGAARRSSLLDDQGRFRPDTDGCVLRLREAVTTLSTLLDTDAGCCACLASASDRSPEGAVDQCLAGIAIGTAPAGLGSLRRCDTSCAPLLLRQPSSAARQPGAIEEAP